MTDPQRFGDYVLLEPIARGGMAELFIAKRTSVEGFEKTLAIKRILPELSSNPDFVSMFINEAKIAARLSHPNIVQIFDFGKVGDHYFIAMEYVHGENLRAVLEKAKERGLPFPHDLAATVIARTCAALDHAHRKVDDRGQRLNIIHRDVSPQNVLVSYDGEVKIVDFGIAKALSENPEATKGVIKGKLAYLSPEQVAGRNLDARSDVFSTGILLYEVLAGRRLFDQSSSADLLDAILKIDAGAVESRLPSVHRKLREVLRRSLQADREQRYASAGEMQAALEGYLRERGDVGGNAQIAKLMRLLFDDRIGTTTFERLRSEVLRPEDLMPPAAASSPFRSPRILAAAAGSALGLAVLVIAAPAMRTEDVPAPVVEAEPEPQEPVARAVPPVVEKPDPSETEIERARTALAAGNAEEAIAAFVSAFAADPELRSRHAAEYAEALSADGRRRFEEGLDGAAERFQAAVAADPDLFEPHFYLAKIHTRNADPEGAIREYREAVRIDPGSADAQFNLGFVYFSQKRYEDALRQYEATIRLEPPYLAEVFYNVSACYERMDRKADAVAALRRGLETDPDSELLRERLRRLGG